MGLITKEIAYDHQLKQLTNDMTVIANWMSINKELSLINYKKTEEENLTTQLKEAWIFLYNKNMSVDYSDSIIEPKIKPLVCPKNRYL